jgi:hypothetical protein
LAKDKPVEQRHPLGDHNEKMLYPDELLRRLGITEPIHPNQDVRLFWRYCQGRFLIGGRYGTGTGRDDNGRRWVPPLRQLYLC